MKRDQRGVAAPSPLVMLSIIAVAMAGIAFVVTKDQPAGERKIENVRSSQVAPSASPSAPVTPTAKKKAKKPKFKRGQVYVEVYNNSGVKGLAAGIATKAGDVGWNVVGADNWYGTIPATTVYYPERLSAAAKQLALDLGIDRVQLASGAMKRDRLTVILTG